VATFAPYRRRILAGNRHSGIWLLVGDAAAAAKKRGVTSRKFGSRCGWQRYATQRDVYRATNVTAGSNDNSGSDASCFRLAIVARMLPPVLVLLLQPADVLIPGAAPVFQA